VGAGNLASQVSNSASQLFAKNILAVLNYIIDEDTVQFDLTDDVLKDLVATHKGDIVNPRLRKALDLPDLPDPHTETEES
jgi:NAD(P) transhydrogenase subunit alpha